MIFLLVFSIITCHKEMPSFVIKLENRLVKEGKKIIQNLNTQRKSFFGSGGAIMAVHAG